MIQHSSGRGKRWNFTEDTVEIVELGESTALEERYASSVHTVLDTLDVRQGVAATLAIRRRSGLAP